MAEAPNSQYVIPSNTEIALLDCQRAFDGLLQRERFYAHHIAQASFKGGLIVLFQTSPESPGIFVLLQKLFKAEGPETLQCLARSIKFSEEEIEAFFTYVAAFYCNMGNYKSFGDTKFVPGVEQAKVEAFIKASRAFQEDTPGIQSLWDSVKVRMFSLDSNHKELGFRGQGTSTYYSANCDENDAKIAQEFMSSKDISPYNTRLFKTTDPNSGQVEYEVRLASADNTVAPIPGCPDGAVLGDHMFTPSIQGQGHEQGQAVKFRVTRGDYSELMAAVCEELTHAVGYAANDTERDMLREYITCFTTGSIPAHKEGSRHWVRNQGPIVETYIGFIESYRDPHGVRGEFEGFAAVVNKAMSAKFAELVNNAQHFLAHLPWPQEFEKDEFLRPDFTSLDVLAFGGSGIPAGINIPNYDDIRQSHGFKNVALGNVLTCGYGDTTITFLGEEDKALYRTHKLGSFEIQVGLHELLGHGSGKLFMEDPSGGLNFDRDVVRHPETNEEIRSWYRPGETYDSIFAALSSSYEECRAECVGIYLCLMTRVLEIFGYTNDDADDIIYVNWLNMVRAGLLALEFYSPDTGSWRQAHMNARFVILRVLLEAGEGLITIERITNEDGRPDIRLVLDRARIISVGRPAIGAFLKRLQVYKSIADVESAKAMYAYYSDVNDHEEPQFRSLRTIVLARKQPRRMFVQHHTHIRGEEVELKNYEPSAVGLIQSFVDRFPTEDLENAILRLWQQDQHLH